jgi:hypothetical protein
MPTGRVRLASSTSSLLSPSKRMNRTLNLVLIEGTGFFLAMLSIYIFPEIIGMFLLFFFGAVSLVVFVSSSVVGFTTWRKTSKWWPAPAVTCFVLIILALEVPPPIGRRIADWRFEKNLDPYSKVVSDLRNGVISCTDLCNGEVRPIQITSSKPRHIAGTWGAHCDDNGVIVLFLANTDVPLLHEGYYFRDYGQRSNCGTRNVSPDSGWPHVSYVRHVTGNWYHFSDQLGL